VKNCCGPRRWAAVAAADHDALVRRGGQRCQDADDKLTRVTVHELRHTAASLMIASGANVKTVQSQFGHKTATMTLDQYGHLFPDDLGDVADGMDERFGPPAKCAHGGDSEVKTLSDLRILLWSCRESNPGPTAFPRGFSVRSPLCLYSDLPITRTSQDDDPSRC